MSTTRKTILLAAGLAAFTMSLGARADDGDYATHSDVNQVYEYVDKHINDTNANVQRVETSGEEDDKATNDRIDELEPRVSHNTSEIARNFDEHQAISERQDKADAATANAQATANRAQSTAERADVKADAAYDYTGDVDKKATLAAGDAANANSKADANHDAIDGLRRQSDDQAMRISDTEAATNANRQAAVAAQDKAKQAYGKAVAAGDKATDNAQRLNAHDDKLADFDSSQTEQDKRLAGHDAAIAKAGDTAQAASDGVRDLGTVVADQGKAIDTASETATLAKTNADQANGRIDLSEINIRRNGQAIKGIADVQGQHATAIADAKSSAEQASYDAETAIDNSVQAGTDASYSRGQSDAAKLEAVNASGKADAATAAAGKSQATANSAHDIAVQAAGASQLNAEDIKSLNADLGQAKNAIAAGDRQSVADANAYTDSKIAGSDRKIDAVRKEARQGIASVAALSSIPSVPGKDLSIGVGVGHFSGETAASIGGAYHEQGSAWSAKAGVGFTESEYTAGVGVSLGF